jgi:hypothetical protein
MATPLWSKRYTQQDNGNRPLWAASQKNEEDKPLWARSTRPATTVSSQGQYTASGESGSPRSAINLDDVFYPDTPLQQNQVSPGPRRPYVNPRLPIPEGVLTPQRKPYQVQYQKPDDTFTDIRERMSAKTKDPKNSSFMQGDIYQKPLEEQPGFSGYYTGYTAGLPERFDPETFAKAKEANPLAYNIGKGAGTLTRYATGYMMFGPAIEGIKGLQAINNPFLRTMATEGAKDLIIGSGIGATEGAIQGKSPGEIAKDMPKQLAYDTLANLGFYGAGKAFKALKPIWAKRTVEEAAPAWAKSITMPDGKPFKNIDDAINVQPAKQITGPKTEEGVNAIWKNKDFDQPVKVVRDLGIGPDGRRYVQVQGSNTGIPIDEIQFKDIKPSWVKQEAAPVWAKSAQENAGLKPRSFPETAARGDIATPEFKKAIGEADISYTPINNRETLENAKALIQNNPEKAMQLAKSNVASPESFTVSQLLIKQAQDEGRVEDAIELLETLSRKATSQGQTIQVLSMWGRLTPEGMLRYAQRQIDKVNFAHKGKDLKLTPKVASEITEKMKNIQKMPEGRDKVVETKLVLKLINDQIPATIGQKISSVQTMAQLLNPKTAIRNIVGNVGFAAAENVSDIIGTAIDLPLSKITGQRTKVLPSIRTQLAGFGQGWKEGLEDALKGIDTSGIKTRYDLSSVRAFKGTIGDSLQKLMDIELRATDRAFYQAAFKESLRKQMTIYSAKAPTDAMIEIAHLDGLYRTFQDTNVLTKVFTGLKRSLNAGKDFGLGDFVIKYPKTPANILSRGIEYSPFGFVQTAMNLLKDVSRKQPFNQRRFVEELSRATTGSVGLVGAGSILHRLGIITGRREEDYDLSSIQQLVGLGDYRINTTALHRLVMSGFDPKQAKVQKGDTIMSYDWFQPASINLAMGADIDANNGELTAGTIGSMIGSMTSGIQTLEEQPLVSGIARLFRSGSVTEGVKETLKNMPASFTPTLLNQINQLINNTSRNVYGGEGSTGGLREAYNRVARRTPGLSGTLNPNITVFGQEQQVYQGGSNNLFNVFLNPAFMSKYNPTPEAKLVLDLYEETGMKTQAPRVQEKYIRYEGETYRLTPDEYEKLQRYVGGEVQKAYSSLANNMSFRWLPPEEQIKTMQNILTDIGKEGRNMILRRRLPRINMNNR